MMLPWSIMPGLSIIVYFLSKQDDLLKTVHKDAFSCIGWSLFNFSCDFFDDSIVLGLLVTFDKPY